jgi:hypothetical protein
VIAAVGIRLVVVTLPRTIQKPQNRQGGYNVAHKPQPSYPAITPKR